ncbi:MAG: 30S ribosomal protein S3 [Candidatus Saccharimonadales bacterium]
MGHKVNPTSMRLQVNKNWQSKWFASKRDYADTLNQDIKIRGLIAKQLDRRAAINRVEIERSVNSLIVNIYTARPGVVIGRGGESVETLKKKLSELVEGPITLNIEEIKKPELYAQLVADNIASQLERRISFRRAIKSSSDATMRAGAKGIKIVIAGRLNGAEMARTEKEVVGSIPLHTLRADIDYAATQAITTYGVIGVKVWIYKGEE